MPIIRSILDDDFYKFLIQNAILRYKPNVLVRHKFFNRRPEGKFNRAFFEDFQNELYEFPKLHLTDSEYFYWKNNLGWIGRDYIELLRSYRFDPSEVKAELTNDNELSLETFGPWWRTVLWEVPLMALISELYFTHCDKNWKFSAKEQIDKITEKEKDLTGLKFSDFGTRRRRSYVTQDLIVSTLRYLKEDHKNKFQGTSNVHLAMKYSLKPIGTIAHEFIQGISALESLRHANRYALKIWSDIYKGNAGIALPDTFGTDAFFADFDAYYANLYQGLRQDSGNPFTFADKTIKNYFDLKIRSCGKEIVFSDSLNTEKCQKIGQYLTKYGSDSPDYGFGIGTALTNDFDDSRPLNMVIKMVECDGIPVVKLSDDPGKAIGDPDALRVARWTFFKEKLDGNHESSTSTN